MKILNKALRTFLVVLAAFQLSGCLESSFTLAEESRLPKWLEAPEGVPRSNLRVTMDYYSTFSGGEYVFKLYDKNKFLKMKELTIDISNAPYIKIKGRPQGPMDYPRYHAVTVNGVVDILEHRKMEPIFYTTDDPAIWQELGVTH